MSRAEHSSYKLFGITIYNICCSKLETTCWHSKHVSRVSLPTTLRWLIYINVCGWSWSSLIFWSSRFPSVVHKVLGNRFTSNESLISLFHVILTQIGFAKEYISWGKWRCNGCFPEESSMRTLLVIYVVGIYKHLFVFQFVVRHLRIGHCFQGTCVHYYILLKYERLVFSPSTYVAVIFALCDHLSVCTACVVCFCDQYMLISFINALCMRWVQKKRQKTRRMIICKLTFHVPSRILAQFCWIICAMN